MLPILDVSKAHLFWGTPVRKARFLFALIWLLGSLPANYAQDGPKKDNPEERIKQLESKITQLMKRIEKLEKQLEKLQKGGIPAQIGFDMTNWRKLKRGLTEAEVKSILGEPTSIRADGLSSNWTYEYPTKVDPKKSPLSLSRPPSGVVIFSRDGQLYQWSEPNVKGPVFVTPPPMN